MDPATGMMFAGGSNLAAGGIDYASARATNRASERIAREDRAFQERMSNTQYQRAADDLEKAGLNRILALGSGAGTPGGRGAGLNAPTLGNAIKNSVSSAMEYERLSKDLDQADSTIGLQKASKDAAISKMKLDDTTAKNVTATNANIREENKRLKEINKLTKEQVKNEIETLKTDRQFIKSDSWLRRVRNLFEAGSSALDVKEQMRGGKNAKRRYR